MLSFFKFLQALGIALCLSFGWLVTTSAAGKPYTLSKDLLVGPGMTEAGEIPLKLDIYLPKESCEGGCKPVVYIHSGGFEKGSKAAGEYYSEQVTGAGFALVAISYRLASDKPKLSAETLAFIERGGVVPEFADLHKDSKSGWQLKAYWAAIEDTLAALDWISKQGAEHGLDPSQAVLWGSSAGGITALNVTYGSDQMDRLPQIEIVGAVNYWGALGPLFFAYIGLRVDLTAVTQAPLLLRMQPSPLAG